MPEPLRQFVLLRHEHPAGSHWDLMIESGQALATWQLADDPTRPLGPGTTIPATRLADHRRAYLDYEGPLSRDRGQVTRLDGGPCAVIEQTADGWVVRLEGTKLAGTFRLTIRPGQPGHLQRLAR